MSASSFYFHESLSQYYCPSQDSSQSFVNSTGSLYYSGRTESDVLTMSQQLTPPSSPPRTVPDAPRPNKRPLHDRSASPNARACVPETPQSYHNPFAKPSGIPAKREIKNLSGAPLSRLLTDFRLETNTEVVRGQKGRTSVYFAQHRLDGMFYAIKVIEKGPDSRVDDLREVQAMAAVGRHPNVVGYHASWLDDERIWMQLERCDSTLAAEIAAQKPYAEKDFLRVASDVACGLTHLHGLGIAHLDVKPDNIFFCYCASGRQFKLGDFGQAKRLDSVDLGDEGDSDYYRSLGSCSGDQMDLLALARSLSQISLTFTWESFREVSAAIAEFVQSPQTSVLFLSSQGSQQASQMLYTEAQGALRNLQSIQNIF